MNSDKNILIAEFCGFQETNIGWYDAEEILNIKGSNTFDELLFDESFDWLMPVGKYIINEFTDVDVIDCVNIYIVDAVKTFNLEDLYDGIVECIYIINAIENKE